MKRFAIDTEAAIKAQLDQVQRAREIDEASVSIPKVNTNLIRCINADLMNVLFFLPIFALSQCRRFLGLGCSQTLPRGRYDCWS